MREGIVLKNLSRDTHRNKTQQMGARLNLLLVIYITRQDSIPRCAIQIVFYGAKRIGLPTQM